MKQDTLHAAKKARVLYRAAISRRKKLHIPDASSITAGAVRDGTMLGIVFGALPKFAAALSVAISSMQLYNMLRNAWRKRRKGRKKPPPRCKRCGSRWHTSCADPDDKKRNPRKQKPRRRHRVMQPSTERVPADARAIAEAMR